MLMMFAAVGSYLASRKAVAFHGSARLQQWDGFLFMPELTATPGRLLLLTLAAQLALPNHNCNIGGN